MDIFTPYYDIARKLFLNTKIVRNQFHIIQYISRAMSRLRIQIMNQLERKSIEFKALKRYWKLIALNIKKERTNLVLSRL